MKRTEKRVAVWVRWVDSASRQGWHAEHETVRLMTAETVGWLVAEDAKTITVCLSRVFDDSSTHPLGHLLSIPQCAVLNRVKVPKWSA
jgi:hypothetical protein